MPSSEFPPRRVLVAGAVVAVVAAAAILGVLSTSQQSAKPVGANASDRVAAIDGVEATVRTTIRRGNRTNQTLRRVKMRPNDGKVRSESVGDPTAGPELVVSNGSITWRYDRDNGTVRRTNATTQKLLQGGRIEQLFRQAQVNETSRSTPEQGISPLPAVPRGGQTPSQPRVSVADVNGTYNVEYEGTDTVDDRRVYVLHITAEGNGATDYRNFSQRLWIDAEWYMPLKYRTTWVADEETVETSVRYSNVSFNPGLSSGSFTFEMPEDAALVTPDLGTDASDRLDALNSISATNTMRLTGLDINGTSLENDTYRTVQRVRTRFETGEQRLEMLSSTDRYSSAGADLFVSNGTVTWVYDRTANNVTILRGDTTGNIERRGERIERLFAQLNRTRATPADEPVTIPNPGLSPTPGLDGSGRVAASPPTSDQSRYGVSFGGVETVDGRPAYVLEIAAIDTNGTASSSLRNYSQTMWLDTEYFFPLKQRSQFESGNDTITSVTTYTNVSVNPEFDDELFEFEPPANATVSVPELSLGQNYEQRSAIEVNATVPVPDPPVPQDFQLSRGRTSSTEFAERVSLIYTNETSQLQVTVYEFNQSFGGNGPYNTTGETVELGNRTGTYTQSGLYQSVSWSCNELEYSISGQAVSKSLLVEIARSIECGTDS